MTEEKKIRGRRVKRDPVHEVLKSAISGHRLARYLLGSAASNPDSPYHEQAKKAHGKLRRRDDLAARRAANKRLRGEK